MSHAPVLFRVYDVDEDGKIGEKDLEQMLKLLVGSHVSDAQRMSVVAQTIQAYDNDGDGCLSFEEFQAVRGAWFRGGFTHHHPCLVVVLYQALSPEDVSKINIASLAS